LPPFCSPLKMRTANRIRSATIKRTYFAILALKLSTPQTTLLMSAASLSAPHTVLAFALSEPSFELSVSTPLWTFLMSAASLSTPQTVPRLRVYSFALSISTPQTRALADFFVAAFLVVLEGMLFSFGMRHRSRRARMGRTLA
jgi:hypothetical protein